MTNGIDMTYGDIVKNIEKKNTNESKGEVISNLSSLRRRYWRPGQCYVIFYKVHEKGYTRMVVISYGKTSTFGHEAKGQIDDAAKFSEDNNVVSHMRHLT